MSIKQPRRSSTPPRRRPRIAGETRRTSTPGTSAEPVEAPTSAEPVEAPALWADDAPARPRESRPLLPPKRTLRWLLPLTVLAVAGVTFGAVTTVQRAQHDDGAAAQQRADDAAASAASTAAQHILGYSYTSVAADLATAQKQMTPAFAKKFAKVVPTVESLAAQRKLVVKASVRNTAVLECGEDCSTSKVRVLLYVDQERTGDGTALDAIAVRTVFTMTKTDGHWLVSGSVSL